MTDDNARPIRQLLLRIRTRLLRNRLIRELSDLLRWALVVLLAWTAWNTLMPSRWIVGGWALAMIVAALAIRAAVRIARQPPLWEAAAAADRGAGLQDELTSAWWFARHGGDTPWVAAHVERAAERARELDARRLVAAERLRHPALLGGLAAALAAFWMLPVPRLFEPVIDRLAEVLPGDESERGAVADLPDAVAEEPAPPAPTPEEMLLPAEAEGGEQVPGEEAAGQEGDAAAQQEPGEQQGEPGDEGEPAEGQQGEPQDQQAPSDAEGEPSPDAEASPQEGEGEPGEESGTMLPGGDEVFLQESGEDMQQAEQAEEEMGHATREGGTEQELDTGELTTLEVQLQREMLLMPEEPPRADPEAENEEEMEEEVTKAERSFLDFVDRPAMQESAVQELLESEAIPWRYRKLVLDYFKALRARDNQQRDRQQ